MALNVKLDKATYAPGDRMTLTVTTAAGERSQDVPVTVHIDVAGVGSTDVTGTIAKPAAPVAVVDSARVWSQQSDDGTTAVFTATA